MKLISFITISFLAITVSAWPHRNSPYQNIRSSQSPRQFDQDEVEAEIERLTTEYEKEQDSFFPMDDDVNIRRQNAMDLGSKVNSIIAEFEKTGLNSYVRLELEGEYYDARMKWDDAVTEYNEQLPDYETARQKYNDAKAALYLLRGNQDLIVKHNTDYGGQIEPSLGSFYSIGLLKKQKDDLLKRIKDLLAKWKRINNFKAPLNDGLVTQRAELKDEIRFFAKPV
ncbi:hypothetical protein BASA62_005931 [Batrachochytrium salamandrivorans]|nr:hypothetical protein BASA62_005931 [Batrachochytrium salamandrivorans]